MYLGDATSDAKNKFISQFVANLFLPLMNGSDNKYGSWVLVIPYKSTATVPSDKWYKVPAGSLDLSTTDELNFWVNVSGQLWVKERYLDMVGYQYPPLMFDGDTTSRVGGAASGFMKYLPYVAAAGGALLLLTLLKKKG